MASRNVEADLANETVMLKLAMWVIKHRKMLVTDVCHQPFFEEFASDRRL